MLLPLLNTACEILSIKLETFKAKYSLEITETNSKIKKVAENEGYPENKRVIGFTTKPAVEEETLEEEDEYEDD